MNTSVVLVPGAPALVPALSGLAAADSAGPVEQLIEMLRAAARHRERVVVWGADAAGRRHGDGRSTLRRWGVDLPVGGASTPGLREDEVPDAALLGWWFLDRAGVRSPRSFAGVVDESTRPPEPEPGGLVVVVADGPAALTPRAPLPGDPRGVALDGRLTTWVTGGGALPDPGADEAAEVGWWSRPAWLALAGLTGGSAAAESVSWAPFGVGYHGARWEPVRHTGESPGAAEGGGR